MSLISALLFLGLLASSKGLNDGSHPNILLLVADDMRPNLGCLEEANSAHFSSLKMHTPHLDTLASESLLLENAFVQQAVCSPSRTSLLTGRRPDTTRVTDLFSYFRDLGGNFTTIPQFFKEHGYRTAGMGKVFHDGDEATPGDDPLSWTEPYHRAQDNYNTDYPWPWQTTDKSHSWRAISEEEINENGPLQDTLEADFVIETMREMAPDSLLGIQPFLIAFGLRRPHLPFYFPEEFINYYPKGTEDDPRNPYAPYDMPGVAWSSWGELRAYQDCTEESLGVSDLGQINVTIPIDKVRDLRRAYYASISYVDSEIGRVIEEVSALGLEENTIIVFFGDHGWQLGEHSEWCKHTNFDVAARAPLIIKVPGATNGGVRTDRLVEFVDIFPTLVEAAGFPTLDVCPDNSNDVELCTEGNSLVPLMEDPTTQEWKSAIFYQYPRGRFVDHIPECMGYSIRTDMYRYTEWVMIEVLEGHDYEPRWEQACRNEFHYELYNLLEDPEENRNVARDESYGLTVVVLSDMLRSGWRNIE